MNQILLKSISVILLLFLFSYVGPAQEKYAKVKIFTDDDGLKQLINLGVGMDHGERKKGVYFISDFSTSDIETIRNNGFDFEILIDNVQEYYQNRNNNPSLEEKQRTNGCNNSSSENFVTPDGFDLGSMGGFYTYQEFLDHLDTMYARYPSLITQRAAIDTFQSHENRPIYWLKISDNPNIDESEPKILYTALHHAREPASLSQVIMYMYYLLENYGTNDEVTNIVDNTELYFIPMVNPDGYIQNYTTNPNGGGMWRKNMRNNGDGTTGVDLNRNYGHQWGLDDNGSSPDGNSDTYRGPSAFSEPEIQAVKYFSETHQFLMALNYHTYGNLLIYPWGYAPSLYTPDSAIFVEFAKIMTEQNNYTFGTGDQTVGYVTNGDSDDWQYGEQTTKAKTLSFTPEAGESSDGFWPSITRIEPISKSNLRQNLNYAHLTGKYARTQDLSPSNISVNNLYIPFEINRLGLDSPASFIVSLIGLSPEITSVGNSITFSSMNLLEKRTDSIAFSVDNSITEGKVLKFLLQVDNGYFVVEDTLSKIYGKGTVVFNDDASINTNWNLTGSWNLTTSDYHSAPSSFTDSPNGNYGNNISSDIALNDTIDLTNAIDASLSFWGKWGLETNYDYVQVEASNDFGTSWIPLCGKYTKIGNSNQDPGNPVYNGFQIDWVQEVMSLNDFIGQQIILRYNIETDVFTNEDGFYFDDVEVTVINSTDTTNTGLSVSNSSSVIATVYPNPNTGVFNVSFQNFKNSYKIVVTDILGHTILTKQVADKPTIELNLNNNKGIYFIEIYNENGMIIKNNKIIVN